MMNMQGGGRCCEGLLTFLGCALRHQSGCIGVGLDLFAPAAEGRLGSVDPLRDMRPKHLAHAHLASALRRYACML